MSAFIVGDETIDRILSSLVSATWACGNLAAPLPLPPARLQVREIAGVNTLGRDLLKMNAEALRARYGPDDDGAKEGDQAAADYHASVGGFIGPVQAYKSAQCLRYQCSEGAVPECELYKALDAWIVSLACWYLERSPGYEGAEWG